VDCDVPQLPDRARRGSASS